MTETTGLALLCWTMFGPALIWAAIEGRVRGAFRRRRQRASAAFYADLSDH